MRAEYQRCMALPGAAHADQDGFSIVVIDAAAACNAQDALGGRAFVTFDEVTAKMSTEESWAFLSRAAPVLGQSGFGILLPPGLEDLGKKRLRARVRLGVPSVAFAPALVVSAPAAIVFV